jgi:hypothetical protein
MDPLRPVRGGDPIRMSANTQNALLRAAAAANSRDFGSADGPERDDAQVLIVASATLARFAPFALGTCVTTPATDSQFQRLPAFNSAAVTEDQPFGIMIDPAYSGSVGRGILCGLVPAQVTIADADDEYVHINSSLALESAETGYARIIWKAGTSGSQWCLLALPAAASGGTLDDGTAAHQVLVWNDSTKVWEAGTMTQVTYLTDWRLDKTNHKFQVKTRTAYVLSPGS